MSSGPKDEEARGDLFASRDDEGSFKLSVLEDALMTSALTMPSTWRTAVLDGVTIIGASFKKSLE